MRGSAPMISVTPFTSASVSSQRRPIAFAKETFVARNEFEASFASSAVRRSVWIRRHPAATIGS